jgi:tRNA (guanine-N7-)-methyltransferase
VSRRVRKHANPFTVTTRVGVIDRLATFGREAPLEVDLGCGGGAFVFERARNHPDRDFIGLEVRKAMVEQSMARRNRDGPKNALIYYASSNDNLALAPPGVIERFTIQFPDPCFKKRHQKRRILQPKIVRRMAELLPIGGQIYAQSDVKPLAEEMFDFLNAEGALRCTSGESLLIPSPFLERTEWERHHEANGEPIYRMIFEKVQEPSGPIPELPFRDTNPLRNPSDGARVADEPEG